MVFGIDEVGRGCWAGPLVLSAVSLTKPIAGLADSKKLSASKRRKLAVEIQANNNKVIIAEITPQEIDQEGLSTAMRKACEQLFSSISKQKYDNILLDGNINYMPSAAKVECVIGGDNKIQEIMAASIVAKVHRDSIMHELHKTYPEFGFDSNVGYGTKQHIAALEVFGVTRHHRRSFAPIKYYAATTGSYRGTRSS